MFYGKTLCNILKSEYGYEVKSNAKGILAAINNGDWETVAECLSSIAGAWDNALHEADNAAEEESEECEEEYDEECEEEESEEEEYDEESDEEGGLLLFF